VAAEPCPALGLALDATCDVMGEFNRSGTEASRRLCTFSLWSDLAARTGRDLGYLSYEDTWLATLPSSADGDTERDGGSASLEKLNDGTRRLEDGFAQCFCTLVALSPDVVRAMGDGDLFRRYPPEGRWGTLQFFSLPLFNLAQAQAFSPPSTDFLSCTEADWTGT